VLCPQDFQGNFHSSEAVLQPNIWLKVLPKSLHQFRKRFHLSLFLLSYHSRTSDAHALSYRGFSKPTLCHFLAEGAPKSRSGSAAQYLAQGFAEIVAPIQKAFSSLSLLSYHSPTSDAHALSYRGFSKPTLCHFLAEGAPKSPSGSTAQYLAQGFAEIVAPIQKAFSSLSLLSYHSPTSDAHALSHRGFSKPTLCIFLAAGAPKSRITAMIVP